MFPHLKLLCWLFIGPTLGFDTKQRNSFLIKFGVFYNKSKILTILFIVKYEKITLFYEFLVLLVSIISRFFACSNEEKINKNNKACVLKSYLYGNKIECFQMVGSLSLNLCLYFWQRPDLSQLIHSSMTC